MFWNTPDYSTLSDTEDSYYTVGINNSGMTVLKIHNGDQTICTLAMNVQSTQQLIKLLATATDTVNR